jgi:hypothetical protein
MVILHELPKEQTVHTTALINVKIIQINFLENKIWLNFSEPPVSKAGGLLGNLESR